MNLSSKKLKIVIADDSPEFIEGLELLLSDSSKYQIIETLTNGMELLHYPNLRKSDIILLDIEMPKLNGIEAAKYINFTYPNIPMIALTMHLEKVYLEQFIAVGFKAFIYKPDVANKLYMIMEEVLNNNFCFPENISISNNKK